MLKQVVAFLRDSGKVLDALSSERKSPDVVSAVLMRAAKLADACETGPPASQAETVAALVRRVAVAQDTIMIEIEQSALGARLLDQEAVPTPETRSRGIVTLESPMRFRRRGVEAKLVVLGQQQTLSEPDANLVKALARAHEWFGRIVRGEADGVGTIARAEKLDRTFVSRGVCLAFLAPEIAKGILQGRQLSELTAKRLIHSALNLPLLWSDQADLFLR